MDKRYAVLLVEPDAFLRVTYRRLFEAQDIELIDWPAWPDDVRTQVAITAPDLICTSVLFNSGMNGYQAAWELKRDNRTRSIPIAYLTNLGQVEEVVMGFEFGARDYVLTSQMTPSEVVERCRNILPEAPKGLVA